MIDAYRLREKEELKKIPNDKPGYYKWWATREDFEHILRVLNINFADIENALEVKDTYYCIYIGIAAKESVRQRLDWHINDKHTVSKVCNGTLSTLRQSLSSVYAHNQYDKATTNACIDRFKVEYFCIDTAIKSSETVVALHETERALLCDHLYVLNIMDNHHPLATDIKKTLKRLRKESKVQH